MTLWNNDGHIRTLGVAADFPAGYAEVESAKVPQCNDRALTKMINKTIEKRIYDKTNFPMLDTSLVTYLCNEVFSNNTCHFSSRNQHYYLRNILN